MRSCILRGVGLASPDKSYGHPHLAVAGRVDKGLSDFRKPSAQQTSRACWRCIGPAISASSTSCLAGARGGHLTISVPVAVLGSCRAGSKSPSTDPGGGFDLTVHAWAYETLENGERVYGLPVDAGVLEHLESLPNVRAAVPFIKTEAALTQQGRSRVLRSCWRPSTGSRIRAMPLDV